MGRGAVMWVPNSAVTLALAQKYHFTPPKTWHERDGE